MTLTDDRQRFTVNVPCMPGKVTIDHWAVGEPSFFINQEFDSVQDAFQAILDISTVDSSVEVAVTVRPDAWAPGFGDEDLPF